MIQRPSIDPNIAQVFFADDSASITKSVVGGLKYFCGFPPANIHTFEELDDVKRHIETKYDRSIPSIVILDNNTPKSDWNGYSLAMTLLEQKELYPNMTVVTVSSSDMGLVTDDSGRLISRLRESGGEFWAKHSERFLMTLWIADCLKNGELIPREAWLQKKGIESRYKTINEDRCPEEQRLYDLYTDMGITEEKGEDPLTELEKLGLQVGDAYSLGSDGFLSKLGFQNDGIERSGNAVES